jgi:AraC-like DNA-binding protein
MENLVKQAVITIRRHYDEPLHLDDLARVATMSKFHFLRTFSNHVGITPARYLTAVRIQAAKRLLLNSRMDVAEIALQVGYGSLGTFTTRFTECVGLPPVRYRRMVRGEPMPLIGAHGSAGGRQAQLGTVDVSVHTTRRISSPIMLGLFPTRIPQGQPVACSTAPAAGRWQIPAVPPGTWHLLGVSIMDEMPDEITDTPSDLPFLVANPRMVRMQPGGRAHTDVVLRPVHWTDPPLLVALPGVDCLAALAA